MRNRNQISPDMSFGLVGTREAARYVAEQFGIAGSQFVDGLAMACAEGDHCEGVGMVAQAPDSTMLLPADQDCDRRASHVRLCSSVLEAAPVGTESKIACRAPGWP
jgi:hypothetical protein